MSLSSHDLIGVSELAKRLGFSEQSTRRAIRLGQIPAAKVGRFYVVEEKGLRERILKAAERRKRHGK